MDRRGKALGFLDLSGPGLEIGPSYSPLVPKSPGIDIETVDHAPRDELVDKFRAFAIPEDQLALIDDVDHIWTGGSLVDAVGRERSYEFVVASHVVEHSVDLIGFLKDCERLITDSGRISLVVPDKRFCFDHFRPVTSLGQVVDAHLRPTRFHSPGALLDHHAYACTQDGVIAWSARGSGVLELQFTDVARGREVIERGSTQTEYHDIHRWVFTPSSFSLLLQDLRALGFHSLVEVGAFPTAGFEFFVTLARARPGPDRDRLELLLQTEAELGNSTSAAGGDERPEGTADLRERLADAERRIAELTASTSWRVTRPLRALGRRLRRRESATRSARPAQ